MTAVVASTRALGLAELSELARFYADNPDLWQRALRIPAPGEDRFWTLLDSDGQVDVWLLSWLPGQSTDLHDHGASAAAFAVASGTLAEVRLDPAHRPVIHERTAGGVTWVAPGVVHDVHGAGEGPAVSIHAYSPPLTQMTYYERGADDIVRPIDTVRTNDPEKGPRR